MKNKESIMAFVALSMKKCGEKCMNKDKKESVLLSLILMLAGMLLIISGSIAVPILIRPLYYMQIGPLGLKNVTVQLAEGARTLTRAEIITAYNEMMDYSIGLTGTFSTGVLSFSEEGRLHFVDVRGLFLLDLWVLIITGLLMLCWVMFKKYIPLQPKRILGKGAGFWTGVLPLALFALIGIFCLIDFNKFFTAFHHVFFPGKSNWIFDPRVDQVINILPEQVFLNFMLMIVALILISCLILIISGCRKKKS